MTLPLLPGGLNRVIDQGNGKELGREESLHGRALAARSFDVDHRARCRVKCLQDASRGYGAFKTTHQEISPATKGKAGFQQGPNTSFSSSRSFMESVFPR
jgi:hypothetical protein